jgi:hypothetical protein
MRRRARDYRRAAAGLAMLSVTALTDRHLAVAGRFG